MELNKIYNEDCLEGMRNITDKSIDMILCDLPYGTTVCKWDEVIPLDILWTEYSRIIKESGVIVLTGAQPFTSRLVMSNLKDFRYEIIWEKDRPSNPLVANKRIMPQHENILIFYKKQPTYNPQKVIRLDKNKRKPDLDLKNSHKTETKGNAILNRSIYNADNYRHPYSIYFAPCVKNGAIHPTQKPVKLFEYLIRTYTNIGDIVLDNCIGSGTTAIACLNCNRNFIGFEKEIKFYDLAVDRIEKTLMEPKLAM